MAKSRSTVIGAPVASFKRYSSLTRSLWIFGWYKDSSFVLSILFSISVFGIYSGGALAPYQFKKEISTATFCYGRVVLISRNNDCWRKTVGKKGISPKIYPGGIRFCLSCPHVRKLDDLIQFP